MTMTNNVSLLIEILGVYSESYPALLERHEECSKLQRYENSVSRLAHHTSCQAAEMD